MTVVNLAVDDDFPTVNPISTTSSIENLKASAAPALPLLASVPETIHAHRSIERMDFLHAFLQAVLLFVLLPSALAAKSYLAVCLSSLDVPSEEFLTPAHAEACLARIRGTVENSLSDYQKASRGIDERLTRSTRCDDHPRTVLAYRYWVYGGLASLIVLHVLRTLIVWVLDLHCFIIILALLAAPALRRRCRGLMTDVVAVARRVEKRWDYP